MGKQWLLRTVLVIFTSELCISLPFDIQNENDAAELEFPAESYMLAPHTGNKRLSKFVRIGRGLSSFIRIGRGDPDVFQEFSDDDLDLGDSKYIKNDNSAFLDNEPDEFQSPDKRISSFVRIGRNFDDGQSDLEDTEKRAGAFIRMGKFPSSAFLRSRGGRIHSISRQPYYRRTGRIGHSSFIRIGKRDTSDALRRQEEEKASGDSDQLLEDKTGENVENENEFWRRYLRLGKAIGELEGDMGQMPDKRISSFVRIGRGGLSESPLNSGKLDQIEAGHYMDGFSKRPSAFVRIGRQLQELRDVLRKRISSFVRIGRNPSLPMEGLGVALDGYVDPEPDMEKRYGQSSFVRIGKNTEDLNPNKRISSFVRIGKNTGTRDYNNNEIKRISSFVRIGKNDQPYKRISSFVRIGRDFEPEKRANSFVRIGKDLSDNAISTDNGPSKRTSSFVRIGKDLPHGSESEDEIAKEANAKRVLSNFVRIGKADPGKTIDEDENVIVEVDNGKKEDFENLIQETR